MSNINAMNTQFAYSFLNWFIIITIIPFAYFLLFIQKESWQNASITRKWIFHISLIGITIVLALLMFSDFKFTKLLLREGPTEILLFSALVSALSTSVVLEILSAGIQKVSRWMRTVYPVPFFILWPVIMVFQVTIMLLVQSKSR